MIELCANPVCLRERDTTTTTGLCDQCQFNFGTKHLPMYGYPVEGDLKVLSKKLKDTWRLQPTDEAAILKKVAGERGHKFLKSWSKRPSPNVLMLWKIHEGTSRRLYPIRFRLHELLVSRNSAPSMEVIRQAFIAGMLAYEIFATQADLPRRKRKQIADWYAGAVFMRQKGAIDRYNGKVRIHFYTYNDYTAIGNHLLDTVFDVLTGAQKGFVRNARRAALSLWSYNIGTWWHEGGYLSAKVYPHSHACPMLNDRLFAHWVNPAGMELPAHLKQFANARRGFRGQIKRVRPLELDQPRDRERDLKIAQLNSIKIAGLPKIEKLPKPTHKPDTSWIL